MNSKPSILGDALSVAFYAFIALSSSYREVPTVVYLPFVSVLAFVLPGWHIVRTLVNRGFLPTRMDLGLTCALVPTLSVSTSLLVGSFEYLLHFRPEIVGLAAATAIAQLLAFFTRRNPNLSISRLQLSHVWGILGIVSVPICEFTLAAYLILPTSPFPYYVGWDTFTYMMLAGRAYSSTLSFPITNINPVTQQLPIPVGFPLFASMLLPPNGSDPSAVVALMKFGAVAPAIIGMLWTFSLLTKMTTPVFASIGSVVAYSFVGASIIDTKWFLPASFAWFLSLAVVYCLMFLPKTNSSRALTLAFAVSAVYFHFYTATATLLITALGILATKTLGAGVSRPRQLLLRGYPLFGIISVILVNALGFSFVIAGGGMVTGSPVLLSQKTLLLARTLTPAAWIVGISVAALTLGRVNQWKTSANFLIISLLLYLLPVSAAFRLLFWPATFAVLVTIKVLETVSFRLSATLKTPHPRIARAIPVMFAVLLLASAAYPSLIPPGTRPVYYITDQKGQTVQSNYSLSEYTSATFLSASPPADSYLIVSDPGFSLVLGGLTGQEAVRLTSPSNMKPYQDVLKLAVVQGFNQTNAIELTSLLDQHYDLTKYGGIVLAFSTRTDYWIQYYGVVTWAPVDASYLDTKGRLILEQSPTLAHIYHDEDVDLFYLHLPLS